MAVSDCSFDLIEVTKKSASGDAKADVNKKVKILHLINLWSKSLIGYDARYRIP